MREKAYSDRLSAPMEQAIPKKKVRTLKKMGRKKNDIKSDTKREPEGGAVPIQLPQAVTRRFRRVSNALKRRKEAHIKLWRKTVSELVKAVR